MPSSSEHEMHTANPIAILLDCALTAAIVAAYLPQLRRLRKSTTSETPSIAGLSPFYIFFHAIFCNTQLCYAFLTMWSYDREEYTALASFGAMLNVAPMFAQWVCAVAIVVIYVIGRSKEVGGKCVVPSLLLPHTFVFVLGGFSAAEAGGNSFAAGYIGGFLEMCAFLSTPLVLLLQPCAQWWELRKMSDFGVLSVRSFCLQAAVVGVLALRLVVRFGRPELGTKLEEMGFWTKGLAWCVWDFLSVGYVLWIIGVLAVWFDTKSGKSEEEGENVRMGVFL